MKILLVLSLLTLPEIGVTTVRCFGSNFLYELGVGILVSFFSTGVFIYWAENEADTKWGGVIVISGLITICMLIPMFAEVAGIQPLSILLIGTGIVGYYILMTFIVLFCLGVLLRKLDMNPLELVTR